MCKEWTLTLDASKTRRWFACAILTVQISPRRCRCSAGAVADVTRYTYHDADTRYVVSFEREGTILQAILTERAPLLKRIIARLMGFDGAYQRFTGKVTMERFERGVRVEHFKDRAIW